MILSAIRVSSLLAAAISLASFGSGDTGYAVMRVQAAESSQLNAAPSANADLAQSSAWIAKGEYREAAESLQTYLSEHPQSAEAHYLLGYALYRENLPRESLAQYTAGAQIEKPDAHELAVVAMDYILLDDYRDADKWLSVSVSWAPQESLYWYYLGRTKYKEFRFDEAIAAFEKCLSLHPRDIPAEYNLGLAYEGLDRSDSAISAYKTAIAWQQNDPHPDPQPYLDLGEILAQEAHPEQALPYLQQAARVDPENPRVYEQLGKNYERVGELRLAAQSFEQATRLAPEVAALHFELGRVYVKEGQRSAAQREFARCAALNADHSFQSAEIPNPAPHE